MLLYKGIACSVDDAIEHYNMDISYVYCLFYFLAFIETGQQSVIGSDIALTLTYKIKFIM